MSERPPEEPTRVTLNRRETLGAIGVALSLSAGASEGEAAPARTAAASPPREPAPILYPHSSRTRQTRDLSGLWRFRLDPDGRGEKDGWFRGLDDTRTIAVPCSWNDLFDDTADYFGTAWYETSFRMDPGWRGKRIYLRFGSASYRAKVWLNGRLLGEHVGGHLPFALDAVPALRPDDENRLVVMVENELRADRVPALPDRSRYRFYESDFPGTAYDFFPYSGLDRPVLLCAVPETQVYDLTVTTRRNGGTAIAQIEIGVNDGWNGRAAVSLSDGKRRIAATAAIRNGRGTVNLQVSDARLWQPSDPFLHTLSVALGEASAPADVYEMPIGLRTIAVDGERLLLNGEPVHLTGFGRHEDFFLHGRGLDLAVLVRDFELLRWIGANSFRTSHYPCAEEAMMLADRYGFLVIAESSAVSLAFSDSDDVLAAQHRQLAADLKARIQRDKNYASVVLWSIGNEALTKPFRTLDRAPADAVAKGTAFFADMFAIVRAADPSRPATLVSLQHGPAEWVGQGDVICANSYDGWYEYGGRLEEAEAALVKELEQLHTDHPGKPVIITEFGADAVAGNHADPPRMWSEEYQADMIAMYLKVLGRYSYIIGEHPWAFADFKTPQAVTRAKSMNLKGVFTRDRTPKLAAHLLRSKWRSDADA
ncbi:beta galactosidase jelly roll domain-containing protein [Stakelama sp. CBK3Z-3]|uniref:Beta galactosidase jelly roll domain-containing protein n=1 Tax=Stakelama flava TaxID=2860338 RepID=A0ABS6XP70_9SPHN|nr:glycoside hydrolase family 2 TIM barrel-domain containing protein [Stakelama flava]MBW4332019.1 beta galactosidase jelly roll domain-containing protein [Stakelama flava]